MKGKSGGLFVFVVVVIMKVVESQTDTFSFQYDRFSQGSKDLTYERDAYVSTGSSYLSLVGTDASGNPRRSSVGRVLYSDPIKIWEAGRDSSFQTTIRLRIKPGFVDQDPADGMTFFIIPVNSTKPTGGEGSNLGIYDAVVDGTPIFAVELDVYGNFWVDPSYWHIGINIGSRSSKNTTDFANMIGGIMTVRINYDGPTRRITVVATYGQDTATVSYVYDLTTFLGQEVQVGLSASTGPDKVAFFDVFSWNFISTRVWNSVKDYAM